MYIIQSINGLLLKGFIKVHEAFQRFEINGAVIVQRSVWWCERMWKYEAFSIGLSNTTTKLNKSRNKLQKLKSPTTGEKGVMFIMT